MPRPQQVAPTPLTYRPDVAARVLGVSRATLYRMIAKGDLNAYRLGGATVIRHDDLVKLVDGLEPCKTELTKPAASSASLKRMSKQQSFV